MIDVKSLLNDGGGQASQTSSPLAAGSLTSIDQTKRPIGRPGRGPGVQKRPSNMKRELYNILITQQSEGRDIQSMMPTNVHDMYRNPKANMGKRRVRKYKWVPFVNEARKDGLQLHHWARAENVGNGEPYTFAKWNKTLNIPTYDDAEYKEHLQCNKWTKPETDLLFELCLRFDLRWPVMQDRYETERQLRTKDGKPWDRRSIEDLKERFYTIVGELSKLRNADAETFAFDADNERRRKEQLRKQFERTEDEIEEEERLQEELKKIEARRKERERKAQDLQKLINMEQHSPSVSNAHSPAPGKKKFKSKLSGAVSSIIPAEIPSSSTLRFPEYRGVGAHLRSLEMKLPTNVGQKKLKNIDVVVDKLKLEVNPMGAVDTVAAYNEFRSNIVLLQELKQTLQTAEFDLESLRTRLQQQGLPAFELEPRMRISSLPDGGYDPSFLGGEGAPATMRRITSWIDVGQPQPFLPARKRKAPVVMPSPMELKKSRKN